PIGTPIFIYHETKHWALIGSHICHGWIPKNKIAYVNDEQVSKIMNLHLIAILKDNQELKTIYNKYIGKADIGTIFPLLSEMDNCYNVLFFERDSLANANEINLQISKDISAQKPIPLNIENINQICQQMQGQLYGWGGMYLNRDCSQTMLDMFMPFGILLPRNSKQQANNGGFSVDISDLNIKEKKKFIISNAKPFTTLIGLPGHIMLYIGHIENEPIVFHNMWGIKTLHRKNEGRFVVGKAVITSLEPGKELKYVKKNTTLINRINKLTFIIP
ncbi:MAG: NlpC/P60 family protein, partial [Candidatus Cloacimonetes bacterium]|nr:NlpC/P60 family protein [Candidatus Cloacimonadota bacterium]